MVVHVVAGGGEVLFVVSDWEGILDMSFLNLACALLSRFLDCFVETLSMVEAMSFGRLGLASEVAGMSIEGAGMSFVGSRGETKSSWRVMG